MARARRVMAALAVAALCAPGTWLRSEIPRFAGDNVRLTRIAGPSATDVPQWAIAGIWQYEAKGLEVGGFSGLVALKSATLRAFSDRGYRFTISQPDGPQHHRKVTRQMVQQGLENELWDIEAATRDPVSGTYWIGFENTHAIHRFTVRGKPDGVRLLADEVDWSTNSGIEAMVRLDDGRFVVLPEGQPRGLLFAADPVAGGKARPFAIVSPADGFEITDAAQLPDGRLLVLMRQLVWPSRSAWPPFASLLAIGAVPVAGGTFAPKITLRLEAVLPPENYEGLTLRPRADGRLDVWVIADNNFSVFQRNLLAKLVFDPRAM